MTNLGVEHIDEHLWDATKPTCEEKHEALLLQIHNCARDA
jgi:hypothetical protein